MTDNLYSIKTKCNMNDDTIIVNSVKDIPKESLQNGFAYTLYNIDLSYLDFVGKKKNIHTSFCFNQYSGFDGVWHGFIDKTEVDYDTLLCFQGSYDNFEEISNFMNAKSNRNLKIIKEASLWYADQINLCMLLSKECGDDLTYQEILNKGVSPYERKNLEIDSLNAIFGNKYKATNPKFERILAKHIIGYMQFNDQLALF